MMLRLKKSTVPGNIAIFRSPPMHHAARSRFRLFHFLALRTVSKIFIPLQPIG